MGYGGSSIEIWILHEILSQLKKKIAKIEPQEPLKWRNSLRQIMYTCSVLCSVVKEMGSLTTEHVYIICEANFLILGVPVDRFECFFFLTGLKFHIDFISVY